MVRVFGHYEPNTLLMVDTGGQVYTVADAESSLCAEEFEECPVAPPMTSRMTNRPVTTNAI